MINNIYYYIDIINSTIININTINIIIILLYNVLIKRMKQFISQRRLRLFAVLFEGDWKRKNNKNRRTQ